MGITKILTTIVGEDNRKTWMLITSNQIINVRGEHRRHFVVAVEHACLRASSSATTLVFPFPSGVPLGKGLRRERRSWSRIAWPS